MSIALFYLFATLSTSMATDVGEAESTSEDDVSWDVNASHGPDHIAKIDTTEGTWMSVSVHGNTIIFDLLGDIWSIPLSGGKATPLTHGQAWDSEPRFSPDGTKIAFVSDGGGNEQIWIMNSDGTDAEQFTDESVARVTDPIWDPAGPWILARRRTVDTRSIGVTELWQYHLDGGSGIALTSKDDHPHAGEMTTNGRHIWFSSRYGRFNYDQDPIAGLWRVMRLDRNTGDLRQIVGGSGSAARPHLTPDGEGLIFISRDREKTLLEYKDFHSQQRRVIADWLDHDQMEGFALHGVYPSMDWTDDGDLVHWAKGKLWRVSLNGDRTEIPFHVEGEWRFQDVPRWKRTVDSNIEAKVLRWANINNFGDVAYSAMGKVVVDHAGKPHTVGDGFSPQWSPDGRQLAWTSWSDEQNTGSLHISHGRGKGRTETLPITGQLVNPTFSADGRTIAVLRDPGTNNSPNLGSIPWYELVVLQKKGTRWSSQVLEATVDTGVGFRAPRITIHNDRIWWLTSDWAEDRAPANSMFISVALNGTDRRDHLQFPGAVEAVPSPDFTRIAYKLDHQAWVTAMPPLGTEVSVDDLPTFQLTEVVGDWLGWTPDSTSVTWVEANQMLTRTLEGKGIPQADEDDDEDDEEKSASDEPLIDPNRSRTLTFSVPRAVPNQIIALTHATVLPMDGKGPMDDATIIIEDDKILSVVPGGEVPKGATEYDLSGKTLIPGLIDVHAHLHYGSADIFPEQPWQYMVNLDFGVTTVHDPSASTDLVFTQAERVEAGLSIGPRVYSTGFVLYGALGNDNAETPDEEAAMHHVERLKRVGATSVKVYQQSQRDQRQWYVKACNALEVLCIAEGGGDLWQDLSMVADGFHAVEHALPNAPIYSDILQFMAASRTENSAGTAYSPTLMVAYGGLSGEVFFYQNHDPYNDERLLRHWDRRNLDALTRRRTLMSRDGDWNHQQVAIDASKMAEKGVLVTMGAHGEIQGIGPHWEMWALGGPDAMSPLDAIKASTISGAEYLGMDHLLGSISPGKFADIVVLDEDPRADLHNTKKIHFVIKNGVIYR
ncbi:MAG: amidohydrolase family protein [Myxococcota bacterium]